MCEFSRVASEYDIGRRWRRDTFNAEKISQRIQIGEGNCRRKCYRCASFISAIEGWQANRASDECKRLRYENKIR